MLLHIIGDFYLVNAATSCTTGRVVQRFGNRFSMLEARDYSSPLYAFADTLYRALRDMPLDEKALVLQEALAELTCIHAAVSGQH